MDSYLGNKFVNTVSDFEFYNCKFSPFEKGLIACSLSQYYGIIGNGRICIYNFDLNSRSIKEIRRFNTNDGCFDVAWSEANENVLASAQGDGSLKVWDINNQHPLGNLPCHGAEVYSINWNIHQPELVLTASQDMTIKLHDISKLQTVSNYLGHTGVAYNAVWHPTMPGVFGSCGEDGTFKIWDSKCYEPVKNIKAHNSHVMTLDFNKYENLLATGGSDGSLALWDLRGNANVPLLSIKAHSLSLKKLCFSPFDSSTLVTTGYDMNVRLWNTKLCQQIDIFKHHREFVFGADFSLLDERLLATCGWDRTLNIFSWKDLKFQ